MQQDFLVNFLMGGVSAAVAKTCAAPIERVKLMMQNQGEMIKQGALDRRYTGITECFTRTIRTEGLLSLWRGNTANVLRYFPTQALNFAFKDKIKAMFNVGRDQGYARWLSANIASGGAAGGLSLVFVYSLDYARTRLAADASHHGADRRFKGLADVYKQTYATDGILGLYRGFAPSVLGIMVYRGLYFGLYDSTKPVLLTGRWERSFAASFLLGWVVTTAASTASYPIDTVRRRMMMTSGQQVKYSGAWHCLTSIYRQEGILSFFKGCGANIVRSVAAAGVISLYDQLQLLMFGKTFK
ncbi:hypothetical protein ZYGR_0AL00530 [Zygosaccharomyces rouxii]|uniref:ADP/ATP translocase n=1 Tax=Zygosaccharomyces rouxii TaxID=4956 RepID=A0A1Q3AF76_ZYGRO|nr:hypothetical protein ZYGR_0AL00530 [Zygosaccharomyces rouxii]